MNKKPLVSVVTFNSEKFVFDTLESVKGQTYQNIELIITDDSSTDNTVAICSKWISENKERFTGVRLITSDFNTGITANRNRGFFAANGDWIKHVDGDDLLLPSCVQDYVEFVLQLQHLSKVSICHLMLYISILYQHQNHLRCVI